jgi:hypothetical protein
LEAVNQSAQVLFSASPMHATGQGRKSDDECASLATARTEGLAAKMQGASLKLLGIYLMFDLSLPGGYALQPLPDSPKLTGHVRYRIRGYRSCVWPGEVVALLLDTR